MHAARRRRLVWGVAVIALAGGCRSGDRPDPGGRAPAAAPTGRGTLTLPAAGEWQQGDEQITWTATRRDTLTEVTETGRFGTDGTVRRQLVLGPRGELRTYAEWRVQTVQSPDRSPTPMRVTLSLVFAGDSVARGSKQVDGTEAEVRPYELDAVRLHVRELLARFAAPP